MVTNVIESDEKTTKYILDNKIIGEKEKDLNMNLKKIILNSPIIHKIRASQNPNLLSIFLQEKSKRVESTDSSEEKRSESNRKEDINNVKKTEILISNRNNKLENRNKLENYLKFTFSPIKSLVLSKMDIEDLKGKYENNANNPNGPQLLKIQESEDLNGNSDLVSNSTSNMIEQSEIGNYFNNIHKDSDMQKNKIIVKNIDNNLFEDEVSYIQNLRSKNVIDKNKIDDKRNTNILNNESEYEKKKSFININQSGNQSLFKEEAKAAKKLSLKYANISKKLINNSHQDAISSPSQNQYVDHFRGYRNKSKIKVFEKNKDCFTSHGLNDDLKSTKLNIRRKLDETIRDSESYYNINFNNKNITLNPLANSYKDAKYSKDVKSIEEFKKLRSRRIENSIISAHSIIDYSINNRSDYMTHHERNRNNNSAINLLDKDEKVRSNLISEKIKIGNEKVKELISKTKEKGHFGPYFSLCHNCNERNNQFYEKINVNNAIGILKIIGHK